MKIILTEKEVAVVLAQHCAAMVCNDSQPADFHVNFPNVNSLQAEIVYGESPEELEEHEHNSGDESTKQPTQRRTRRTKAEMEAARAAEEAAKKQAEEEAEEEAAKKQAEEEAEEEAAQQQTEEEPAKEVEKEDPPFETTEEAPAKEVKEVVEQPKEEPVEAAPQPARRSLFGGLSRPTNS